MVVKLNLLNLHVPLQAGSTGAGSAGKLLFTNKQNKAWVVKT